MTKKILCVLPNASLNISGVAFEKHPVGMVTVDPLDKIDESIARKFLRMSGYELIEIKEDGPVDTKNEQSGVETVPTNALGEVDNGPAEEVGPVITDTPKKSSGSKKVVTNG